MKNYFLWSFRQLYLLIFWPTQFEREFDACQLGQMKPQFGERFFYLLKMLPWMVALSTLGNLIAGHTCESFGIIFKWWNSWFGVTFGIAFGIAFGVAFSIAFAVVFSAVGGVTSGVAFGVAFSVAEGVAFGVIGSIVFGVMATAVAGAVKEREARSVVLGIVVLNVVLGIVFGVAFGIVFRVAEGVAFSVAKGIVFGVAEGVVFGTTFSIAGGMMLGVVVGLTLGVVGGVTLGAWLGVAGCIGLGMIEGVQLGWVGGLTFLLAFYFTYFRLVMYPFDAILSVTAYFAGRLRPQTTLRAWRLCPVSWNEVIWLPLPLVGKLLVLLIQQDHEEGYQKIVFVEDERKLQRRVTRAAFAKLEETAIKDLHVKTISDLADMTPKLSWLRRGLAVLPGGLNMVLPHIDHIAQYVGQYMTLHSVYRKDEVLKRAAAEITDMRRRFINAREKDVPYFLQVLAEWDRLLEEEQKTLRTQVEARRDISNPFAFGNPVAATEYNIFTGRRDIIRKIEESILGTVRSPTFLLYGSRRMGKTSILNQLPRLLGPEFAPAFVDCQNPAVTSSAARLLQYLSRELSNSLMRQNVTVKSLTSTELKSEPFVVFDEWLDGVEQAMPDKICSLLCLDEFERLKVTLDSNWGNELLDALRHILQHRPSVALMFVGSHTFEELGPTWTDRFVNVRRVRVSFLKPEEVIPLLTEPEPEFDMTYAPDALDAIIDATNGQPFLTQAVAFELVQFLNEQQRRKATPDDIEKAIARALVSGGEYFANIWNDAGKDGQAILSALTKGEVPPDLPVARRWLREHDVLNDAGKCAVPMMERWLKENKDENRR